MTTRQEQEAQDMINVLDEQNSIAETTNQEGANSSPREGSAATPASSSGENQASEREIINYIFDQEACRKNLVKMVVLHEHPLSIVDQVGFRIFVNNLQPVFKIPTRNTLRSDVLKLYMNQREETMALLQSNEGRVAITTDIWTTNNQKKSYMAVIAHFVDDSWHLQQRLLRFQHVTSPHTVDVLAEHLKDVLLDWNLENKLSTIMVDNCSINDGVVDTLAHKLNVEQLLLGGSILHMRCFAHILNLIVKDGLDIIGQSLEKIRGSCVFWSSTPEKKEKFEETARQLCISSEKSLCCDVKTRWISTYNMLEAALIYKDVFYRLKLCDAQYKTVPSEEDWENAKIISEKLNIFYTTTEFLSETKYTTACHYFARICEIRLALSNWLLDSNPTIANMASRMMEKFENYWSKMHNIMGIATLLDPRFKNVLIMYYYEKIYGDGYKSEVEKVVALCRQLFREYHGRVSKPQVEVSIDRENVCRGNLRLPKDFHLFVQSMQKGRVDITMELDRYLGDQLLPMDENFNVLTWWMYNRPTFPTLQKIAQDIYAIPVSIDASEPAFSMEGRIISPQRSRLHPELVEALACTQNWLKAEFEDLGEGDPFKTCCDDLDEGEDQSDYLVSTNDVEML